RLRAMTEVLGKRVAVQFGMTELGIGAALLGSELLGPDGDLLPVHRSVGRPFDGLVARVVGDVGEVLQHDGASVGDVALAGRVAAGRAPGSDVSEAEIVAWCVERLASVKKPRSVNFVEALPVSSTGKLLRRELRSQLAGGRSS